ncbi:MAG: TolC family protein [Bacteroidia bacterium]|nr:TolC family protein [Bacteroidia bacterium]
MTQLKKYALLFALIVCANIRAQEATSGNFSLQQSIEYALKHSPNYLNAELDYESAEAKRKEVRGLGLPQVNGSVDIKDYLEIPTSLLPGQIFGGPAGSFIPVKFGTKYNATAGVSASQLIFSSDYIFALKGSKVFMNLSKISVTRNKSELTAQVAKAYYLYVITKDRIKLLEANVVRTKVTYENAKAGNKQGLVELIDVERQEVEYNNFVLERDKAVRSLANIEAMLKFQMGYNINDPINLTDSLSQDVNQFEDLNPKADITRRPDYQLAQAQQSFLDLDVKRLKWGYMPTLAAYGSYQFNKQRNEFDFFSNNNNDPTNKWFKIAIIGATLNINIFDGFQRHYKIQQAKIASLKNSNNLRMIQMNSEAEILTSSINYKSAYINFTNQKKNMDLASHVYEVAQKKYEAGVGSSIEVTLAQTQMITAQVNYYGSLYDMMIAKIDYQKAIGDLAK